MIFSSSLYGSFQVLLFCGYLLQSSGSMGSASTWHEAWSPCETYPYLLAGSALFCITCMIPSGTVAFGTYKYSQYFGPQLHLALLVDCLSFWPGWAESSSLPKMIDSQLESKVALCHLSVLCTSHCKLCHCAYTAVWVRSRSLLFCVAFVTETVQVTPLRRTLASSP